MKDYVSRDIENLELIWSFYIDILQNKLYYATKE